MLSLSAPATTSKAATGSKRKDTVSDIEDDEDSDEDDGTYKPPKRIPISDSDLDRSPSPMRVVGSDNEEILEDTDKGKLIVRFLRLAVSEM